jgi:hypothetical protein
MMKVVTTLKQALEVEDFLQLPDHMKPVSSIDSSTGFAVVVFHGERMTTGYSVEVLDIRQDGNMIAVYAEFLMPAPGEIVGEAVTSPYYVLRITKTAQLEGNFTFVLIADGEEVSRQQHVVP